MSSGLRDLVGQTRSARRLMAITASNTVGFAACDALIASAAGTVTLVAAGDTAAVAVPVFAGRNLISVKQVMQTGTDGSLILIAAYAS
jgi:hypothetical protein